MSNSPTSMAHDLDSASKRKRTKAWTPEEDALVQELVRKHGGSEGELAGGGASNIKWLVIGALVPGRTGKQCRERWHNLLNPQVNKQSWSAEEDQLIVACLQNMGTKWSDIAKMMTGRTDNAIKNRWYSTVRRVERYKRAGSNKPMFATPTDLRKNNNPLFHFCLSVHGKKNLQSFGPGEMHLAPGPLMPSPQQQQSMMMQQAAASSNASDAGSSTVSGATGGMTLTSGGMTANTQAWSMMNMNGSTLGDGTANNNLNINYPLMSNVTVASAVDAVDLNLALTTPTRPTSRGRSTPASQRGDEGGDSPQTYTNTLSARRCITPPSMLAVPGSPMYLRASGRNSNGGNKSSSSSDNSKLSASSQLTSAAAAQKKQQALGLKSDGLPQLDPTSDVIPLAMHVDLVQSASEEQRAAAFDLISPQSAKMLSAPSTATLSTPQSGSTVNSNMNSPYQSSISPFLPPTPPQYQSPPNTSSTSSSTSSSVATNHMQNSTTFPMPSPMTNNLTEKFHHAAAFASGGGGVPPHPSPAQYTNFLNSPLPSARPTLITGFSNTSGMNNGSMMAGMNNMMQQNQLPFTPSGMMDLSTPGIMSGNGGPFSNHYLSLQTPAPGGSFSNIPLPTPGPMSLGFSNALASPAIMTSLPSNNPNLFRFNSSITGSAYNPNNPNPSATSSNTTMSPPIGNKRKSLDTSVSSSPSDSPVKDLTVNAAAAPTTSAASNVALSPSGAASNVPSPTHDNSNKRPKLAVC